MRYAFHSVGYTTPAQAPKIVPVTKPTVVVPSIPQPEIKPISKLQAENQPIKNQEDFTPPPISKKPSGNDIASLWQMLLINIKSPSTTALLKLATPLQISPDGVVLTFKNERLVAQISDSNKKQLIVDAADTMFNQKSTSVTVRLAQNGDKVIQPVNSIPTATQAVTTEQIDLPKTTEVKKDVIENFESSKDNVETPNIENNKTGRLETDQEKMVLDLFDGKYVE